MSTLRPWLMWAVSLCVAACASLDRPQGGAPADRIAAERQILVMLRSAPPHFRPDIGYAASYDSRFGREANRRVAQELASRYGLKIVDDWPMPVLGVDCFAMELSTHDAAPSVLERLSLDPSVESAQPMNIFHVLAHNDPLYPLQPSARQWHLAEIHKITTGKNVRIAEVDTGVETDHPDLRGQVALTRNFVDGRSDVAEMHGTAVAGIIAARADDKVGIAGVAPEAKLMALRACWQTNDGAAVCNSFTLAKALQFALDAGAQVINLSLGGPRDRLLARLLDAASARGVTIVSAADPVASDGGFPASHPGVLGVAGEDVQNVSANILRAPDRDIPTTTPGRRWAFVTGSSFAAAHVTGVVALLRELAPDLQPSQIRAALVPERASALTLDRPTAVDACAAVARTTGLCACGCAIARDARSLSPQ